MVASRWCWIADGSAMLLGNGSVAIHGGVVLLRNGIAGLYGGLVLLENFIVNG